MDNNAMNVKEVISDGILESVACRIPHNFISDDPFILVKAGTSVGFQEQYHPCFMGYPAQLESHMMVDGIDLEFFTDGVSFTVHGTRNGREKTNEEFKELVVAVAKQLLVAVDKMEKDR